MKREMKTYLQEAFEAPEPVKKKEFLQMVRTENVSTFDFVKAQIGYIRKRVWVVSVFIFMLVLASADYVGKESIWIVSALVPYIALCAIAEGTRSTAYGMSELEMSTRFSLKSVILARLTAIGCLHALLLGVMIPVAGGTAFLPVIRSGIYVILPYLLTTVLGLLAVRKLYDWESTYVCMGCAVMVSLLSVWTRGFLVWIYEEKYFIWWCALVVYLLVKVIKEYKKIIYQTEDVAWN
ncbi:MAG: hypothetical protein IJ324_05925 [Lachnospiraceae bacterium]|nr:hypothetical protein [Lachnospiraceae bacterium]